MENPEAHPEHVQYPELAAEIQNMTAIDQAMRERNVKEPEYWDDKIDPRNTERMKEVIAEIGWPTISKVGKKGSHDAWLLVQHADRDPAFQRQCLELMKQEAESEVSKQHIAYLEDRVLLKEGSQQLYGTQFEQREGKFVPRPIKDAETVEDRRREMGFDTLEENTRRMEEAYGESSSDATSAQNSLKKNNDL